MDNLLTHINRWGKNAIFTLIDQAFYSGSNFLLSLVLARWLNVTDYGEYSIILSFVLFLGGFNNALILEPVSILSADHRNKEEYFVIVNILNSLLSIFLCVFLELLGLVYLFFIHALTFDNFVNFMFAGIYLYFVLEFWLWRRNCYINVNPQRALFGNLLYFILLLLSTYFLYKQELLSIKTTFISLSLCIVCVLIVFSVSHINQIIRTMRNLHISDFTLIFSENWKYGKWVVFTTFVYWVASGFYLPLLGYFASYNEVGVFKAYQNLLLPIQQVFTGINLLFLPKFSINYINDSYEIYKSKLRTYSIMNITASILYSVLIWVTGKFIVNFLYNQQTYSDYSFIIPYICILIITTSFSQRTQLFLKTSRNPQTIFYSYSIAAIFSVTIGIFLVYRFHILGTLVSIILCNLIVFGSQLFYSRRVENKVFSKAGYASND